MSMDDKRKRIDEIDDELIHLLNERLKIAHAIGQLKNETGEEVYVPSREKAVLERLVALNKGPLPEEAVRAIYREIMSASLALERDVHVAYLGPPATFTHQASRSRFGSSVSYQDQATISDVFTAVVKKSADYGVVPIENSTEGAVTHTLDEFIDTEVKICAEIYLSISHHLMGLTEREKLKRVYSNPQVFGQCRRWLQENLPHVELIPVSSTAKAAEMAAKEKGSGALASKLAAELYGLNVLNEDIQDLGGNTTRFLVLGKSYSGPTGDDKTSIRFAVKHQVGALQEGLEALKRNAINMTRIESRPSKSKAWEYTFFVDVEGHADDENVKRALVELGEHCLYLSVLGAYPNAAGTVAAT